MARALASSRAGTEENARAAGGGVAPWRALYARFGALAGYLLALLAVYVGWIGRDERNINAEHGLGYALGIVGGSLMLALLLYSLRKRLRFMQWLGATSHWFRGHMILGIVGPVLILYHCNFELGDLNSKVALYCTLLVAGSGLVGRYLYAGIHQGLYGRKASLQELATGLERSLAGGQMAALLGPIREELAALDRRVLAAPRTLIDSLSVPLTIGWHTRRCHRRLVAATRREIAARAATSPAMRQHAGRLEQTVSRYLDDHLSLVRKVARFNSFERLFALWHVVHLPFFFMMIAAGLFHVFAVHFF